MTEAEIRSKVVNAGIAWLGCKEADGSHKKIIDFYNANKPSYCTYKMQYTDAWCACFASACLIKAGVLDAARCEVSCSRMITQYMNKGWWVENDAYVPSPGDLILYDWNDNGIGDNTGTPDHVGVVVSVTGSTIKVIEGNMNNAVGYRTLQVNGRYIRGYACPNYKALASATTKTTTPAATTTTAAQSAASTGAIDWSTKVTTGAELARRAEYIAKNVKTLYVMGCFGAPLTGANVNRYLNNHQYNQKAARQQMINAAANQNPPVYGFDCVCLIKGIMWGWANNPAKTYGGAGYAINGVPDYSADGMMNTMCSPAASNTGWANMAVGEALWCSGHIGIYIGNGLGVECTPSWSNKVQITAVGNIGAKSGYPTRNWTKHGKLKFLSYSAAPAAATPAPASKPAAPVVSHTVVAGDTLSKIAAKYNTTVAELAKINNIKNVNVINIGQVIYLTEGAAAVAKVASMKIISSPDYWQTVVANGTVKYLDLLFINVANKATGAGTRAVDYGAGINRLVQVGIMNSPDYWRTTVNMVANMGDLLRAFGGAVYPGALVTNTNMATMATNAATPYAGEKGIYNFLVEKLGNKFAAAGIMGNLYAESALMANNLQNYYEKKLGYTDTTYTAAVDSGKISRDKFSRDSAGYGLAQWTYWSRKQGLYDYAKSVGKSIGDQVMQLEYLWKELNTYGLVKKLQACKTVKEASNIILLEFEKPATKDTAETQNKRASYSQGYYDKYAA